MDDKVDKTKVTMKDKSIVKDAVKDPNFYNDQIGDNNKPQRANMENKKGGR